MEELAELIQRFIDQGHITTEVQVAQVLYHEFCHWVIQNDPELWAKMKELSR